MGLSAMKLIIEGWTVANVTVRDIRVWAALHGIDIVGTVSNPRHLAQTQGLPILR